MAGISWDDQKTSGDPLKRGIAATVVAAAVAAVLPLSPTSERVPVIVRAQPGAAEAVADLVVAAGGRLGEELEIIDGFAAELPAAALRRIATAAGVAAVTPDATLASLGTREISSDVRSVQTSATAVGVDRLWQQGLTGAGVDVALIDSGVADSGAFEGRLVVGPDLSFETEDAAAHATDTFGHGTHLAGIIAGSVPEDGFQGVAPGARLVSVKVADEDGLTDVSQVIAAIDWVVQHRRANGMNIRVLNLAFGTDGVQSGAIDPLAYAAEIAWRQGIVVVVAAGNEGTSLGRLNNPASSSTLLAVGAVDVNGTVTTTDDVVPGWSSRGDGIRNPDVVAPGTSLISLKAAGSRADAQAPDSSKVGVRYVKGSGTSQASAFVSGVAALLLQKQPSLSPDDVKALLVQHAATVPGTTAVDAGAGVIQLDAVATSGKAPRSKEAKPAKADKAPKGAKAEKAARIGSLDGSRGKAKVARDGEAIEGERTVFGTFDGEEWARAAAAGSTWSGSTWSGSTWSGGTWLGSTWSGSTWSGSTWSGSTWSGSTWSGSTWSGSTWAGRAWSTATWG